MLEVVSDGINRFDDGLQECSPDGIETGIQASDTMGYD